MPMRGLQDVPCRIRPVMSHQDKHQIAQKVLQRFHDFGKIIHNL